MINNGAEDRKLYRERLREHRRRRFRRHGRRAYIRSVYSLPSLATLGNAVCGFGAMYVATLDPGRRDFDQWTLYFTEHPFTVAAYLIFLAMVFDGLDGRLARFARHTTDFGGQLDSLADVISFGAAPAFLALQLFRNTISILPVGLSRLVWAVGALFMSCAALRLARFNVSNEHGEQHHFSFLGLPSPGAGGTIAAFVLMQQQLLYVSQTSGFKWLSTLALACVWMLPAILLVTGLLMVSDIRYPHLVNRYLRGKRSMARLIVSLGIGLLLVATYKYTLALATLIYALWGPIGWANARFRQKQAAPAPTPLPESPTSP